jgi:hypothetical protein
LIFQFILIVDIWVTNNNFYNFIKGKSQLLNSVYKLINSFRNTDS